MCLSKDSVIHRCWTAMTANEAMMRSGSHHSIIRRAAAPVEVLVCSRDGRLVTPVVIDTLNRYKAVVRSGWARFEKCAHEWQVHSITIPVNGKFEFVREPPASGLARDPREWIYAVILAGKGIPLDHAVWLPDSIAARRSDGVQPRTVDRFIGWQQRES